MQDLHNSPENGTYTITGGAGFIGSHLAEALLERGSRVLAIDDLSVGRMQNIKHLTDHPEFQFTHSNVSEPGALDRLAEQSDVIVHLAASVGVEFAVKHPTYTIENNFSGTETVLKSALRHGCKVLLASTSEVYGTSQKIPFSEDDEMVLDVSSVSRWSYAAAKMVDEFLTLSYGEEHGLSVVSLRFFNTVGPRQRGAYGMVIPNFVSQALDDEPITVHGDGQQTRCFLDVSDAVRAIIGLSGHPDAPGNVYNVGNPEEVTILHLAEKVKELTGSSSEITHLTYEQAYGEGFEEVQRRVPDVRRIEELLGWRPELGLEDTLKRTIDFVQRENDKG